jgi:hypothetical protein
MGTGSTTGVNGFFSGSNALWVLGTFGSRPTTPEFVAWPPRGFVPYQLAFPRWSFSYNQADFSTASVTMTRAGSPVSLTTLPIAAGFGDNTIVWEPQGITTSAGMTDTTYTVILSNVRVGGVARSFTYDVTVIDPAGTAPVPTSTVPLPISTATPPPTGGITGGRSFSISPSTGGTAMSWLTGTTQTGYALVLFLPTGVTVAPTLPASATSYFDARTFPGTTCYLLVPTGPGGALGRSDLLCWLLNSRTPTGAAQNFTMRLDQSNVATFTWSGPLGGGQSGYQLVPLGSTPIDLPGTATSTTHTLTAPTCYALITQQGGIPSGLTDVVCGFTGVASL